jgi:hypothetical protein
MQARIVLASELPAAVLGIGTGIGKSRQHDGRATPTRLATYLANRHETAQRLQAGTASHDFA